MAIAAREREESFTAEIAEIAEKKTEKVTTEKYKDKG
jgi:hypothetical protein